MTPVIERIKAYNRYARPILLPLKYQEMRSNVFAFFRGTCHLFYEDWPQNTPLDNTPPVWVCGDLHLHNFGSYEDAAHHIHFAVNDFDTAILAPLSWDLARFLTNLFVSGQVLLFGEDEALKLCHAFLDTYMGVFAADHGVRTVDEGSSEGVVKQLLEGPARRKQRTLIRKRTEIVKGKIRLLTGRKALAMLDKQERSEIEEVMHKWAATQKYPERYRVLDIAHRLAGVGSMGVERCIILVEGKGLPRHWLLDLKETLPSPLAQYVKLPQPAWNNEAERVVTIARWFLGMPPAILDSIELHGVSYLLKELQAEADKVAVEKLCGRIDDLELLVRTMAEVLANGHLRSSGRRGSAIADELVAYGRSRYLYDELIAYAREYAKQVQADYEAFCHAYDQGDLFHHVDQELLVGDAARSEASEVLEVALVGLQKP